MKRNFIPVGCFLSLAILFGRCQEERNPNPIPNAMVSFIIDTRTFQTDFAIGTIKTFENNGQGYFGYMGVVVYYHSVDEIFAYDMACPNDWLYGKQIIEHSTQSTARPADLCLECPSCKVKFNLWNDGYPQGTTKYKYPLKKYTVTKLDGTNTRFQVTN